jgi:hypothetical protein
LQKNKLKGNTSPVLLLTRDMAVASTYNFTCLSLDMLGEPGKERTNCEKKAGKRKKKRKEKKNEKRVETKKAIDRKKKLSNGILNMYVKL